MLGSRVDINRLFERLEPTRWRGADIADAFWTFFLRNVHGADAFPDVVNVKQELLVKKTNNTSGSTSPRGTEPYALNDEFFHRRGLTRDDFVNALARCVARPDETFPEWLALAGWNDVCEGDRDPSEYELPPAPSRTSAISAPRRTNSTVQVPDTINKKRKRGASLGPSASDASEATDATCGHVRGAELKKMQKNAIGSLADDVDARGDAHGTHTALRTAHRRRIRPAPTELILPNIKEEVGDEYETSRDDEYESTSARVDFVVAASTLAAATQLGDFNAVAAALRTLIAAAPNVAPNVNDDDDGALTSLASDVFAEYNRDLMTDDADDVTESVFDDEASVFEEDGVLSSRVRILEAPNLESAGIERLDSIPEDAAPDLLEDLLAASL